MNKPKTIKELCEFIWYLEDKYSLLDLEIDGVKVWQYTRMKFYYKLAEASGVLSQPHSKLTFFGKLNSLFRYIKNSLINNYFTLRAREIIVLSHPRVVSVNGEFIDIYTKYFIDELLDNDGDVVEFEGADLGVHQKQRQKFVQYTDWISLAKNIYKPFIKLDVTAEQVEILKKIENEINITFQISVNIKAFTQQNIKTYKAMYKIYNKIFQKVKPNTFYTVVSYGKSPIIKAAKDNNIEVIELQHGTFSRYHLGYSFPGRKARLDYFPDKFYVWSEFWKKAIEFPINDVCVVHDKFRYLEKQKNKFTHLKKREKQLVVLSQGAIGNEMAEKFLKYFDKFKNYVIKYKLHPGEFDRWKNYPALIKMSKFENVEIITNEVPLYELFATSSLQVGVFSTALYEGVEFSCDTVLLNVNGIEYMDKFIALYDVDVLK